MTMHGLPQRLATTPATILTLSGSDAARRGGNRRRAGEGDGPRERVAGAKARSVTDRESR